MFSFLIALAIIILTVLLVRFSRIRKKTQYLLKNWNKKRLRAKFYTELKKINLQKTPAELHLSNLQEAKQKLEQVINLCERFEFCFCLIRLEINHFKSIMQNFDQKIRKQLLNIAKNRLQKILRTVDTVTQVKANSFLILLPMKYKTQSVAHIAHRLQKSMLVPFLIQDKVINLSTQIGIALYPDDGMNLDELLQSVNVATAHSIENHYFFYKPSQIDLHDHAMQISDFLQHDFSLDALKIRMQTYVNNDTQQIEYIYVTPFLSHKKLGMMDLTKHSSALRSSGRVYEIIESQLRYAVREITEWKQALSSIKSVIVPVALNQLLDKQFINTLTQFNTDDIIFDIYALDDDSLNAISFNHLNQILTDHHLKISLSLFLFSQLPVLNISKLPIKILKIDKYLLDNLQKSQENVTAIKMITALAEDSNIILLAEQTDSKKEKDLLKEFACKLFYDTSIDGDLDDSSLRLYKEKSR